MSWFDYYRLLERYNGDLSKATDEEMKHCAKCNPSDPPSARALAEKKWQEKERLKSQGREDCFMEHTKTKLCACGQPQSYPVPHEHDRTERERQIIEHYEQREAKNQQTIKELVEACEAVLQKDNKSLLDDFAYQGPEGAKSYIAKMGKYYDGHNNCLKEVKQLLEQVIAKAKV